MSNTRASRCVRIQEYTRAVEEYVYQAVGINERNKDNARVRGLYLGIDDWSAEDRRWRREQICKLKQLKRELGLRFGKNEEGDIFNAAWRKVLRTKQSA